jgi:hypothetical protein
MSTFVHRAGAPLGAGFADGATDVRRLRRNAVCAQRDDQLVRLYQAGPEPTPELITDADIAAVHQRLRNRRF